MPIPYPDVTGALIAGGRARRLGGQVKGLLTAGGVPLAARTLALFGELFGASLVVANEPGPYLPLGARVVPDVLPDRGAPGGLHAALTAAATGWVFAAACDMPFVSARGIGLLWERRAGAAVVPSWGGRLQPLHGLWWRGCLPAVERAILAGPPSLWALAQAVGAVVVEEREWRLIDPEGRAFENVNTAEDVARLGLGLPRG
jgi:molybdopterin-guanine dinucleotide biosynthesis protein A